MKADISLATYTGHFNLLTTEKSLLTPAERSPRSPQVGRGSDGFTGKALYTNSENV